jgi:hypothetical protein
MMKTTNPNQNLPKPGRIEIIGFFLMVLSLALASCRQQATPTATAPPTAAPAAACQLVSQTPPDNSVLAADTDYNFTWVIKNTSTTKWDQSEYDVIFVSSSAGGSIHSVTISGTGKTPINLGPYTETWAIAQGNKIVCPFDVTVQVQ